MKNNFMLLIALFISLLFISCNKDTSTIDGLKPPVTVTTNTVTISNFAFSPLSFTVSKDSVVTWKNNDSVTHTATSDTGLWDTGNIPPGGSKAIVFHTIGTFPYHCVIHTMMLGTIIVQ